MKLRDYSWWPRIWKNKSDEDVHQEQVRRHGVFETCRISRGDLIIEVDYNGSAIVGKISRSLNAPDLENVRDFLLDYSGESMTTVEDLDIQPDQFNTQRR